MWANSQPQTLESFLLSPNAEGDLRPRPDLPVHLVDFTTYLEVIFPDMSDGEVILAASKLKFDKVKGTIQHQMYEILTSDHLINFIDLITELPILGNAYVAWHTSLTCKDAGAWLLTTPNSKMKAFQLDSREFRTALLLRLFMEQPILPPGTRCNCPGHPLIDKRCLHMLTGCGMGKVRSKTHDNFVAELSYCLNYLGFRTRKEPKGVFQTFLPDDKHVPDITVINPPASPMCTPNPTLLDVSQITVIDGLNKGDSYTSMSITSAKKPCRAAEFRYKQKQEKYTPLCNPQPGRPPIYSFIAMILENTGRMHPKSLQFIKLCCDSASQHKKIEGETLYSYILKRLSICFQKSLAYCILERTYATTVPPSTFNNDHSFDPRYVMSEQPL